MYALVKPGFGGKQKANGLYQPRPAHSRLLTNSGQKTMALPSRRVSFIVGRDIAVVIDGPNDPILPTLKVTYDQIPRLLR